MRVGNEKVKSELTHLQVKPTEYAQERSSEKSDYSKNHPKALILKDYSKRKWGG